MEIDINFGAELKDDIIDLTYSVINRGSQPVQVFMVVFYEPNGRSHLLFSANLQMDDKNPLKGPRDLFSEKRQLYRIEIAYKHSDNDKIFRYIKDFSMVLDITSKTVKTEFSVYQAEESLAMTAFDSHDYETAITLFLSALKSAEEEKNPLALNNILGNLGYAYFRIGEFTKSAFYTRQALEVENSSFTSPSRLAWFLNLGWTCLSSKNTTVAIQYFEKALEQAKEENDEHSIGVALSGIANCFRFDGQLVRAVNFFEQAIESARTHKNRIGLSHRLGNLGLTYGEFNAFEKAIETLKEALGIAAEINDFTYVDPWLDALFVACKKTKDYKPLSEAVRPFIQSLASLKNTQDKLRLLWKIGATLFAIESIDEAIIYFDEAILLSQNLGDNNSRMLLSYNAANTEWLRRNYKRAYELLLVSFGDAEQIKDIHHAYNCYARITELSQLYDGCKEVEEVEGLVDQMVIDKWFHE